MASQVTGYSATQMALHWVVVFLVAFQFLVHDAMETSWRAFTGGQPAPDDIAILTYAHVGAGILVLLLAMARIYLRLTRGAPEAPADEPLLMRWSGEAIHALIYLLLFLLPLSGLAAWFFGIKLAASAHELMTNVMLGAIALHIAGALFQHFVRRSDVLMRMFLPERS